MLATLGVRYHTERTVPSESKPTHFGFGVVLITFVMTITYAAVLCNTFVTRTIQPLVIAGGCCYTITLIVAGKVMCIPEHYRQAINLITLVCAVAVASYSTFGVVSGMTVYVGAILVGELIAFTIEHKRR